MSSILKNSILLSVLTLIFINASAQALNFAGAAKVWNVGKDKPGYDAYSNEFVAYNNQAHLDEKSGCYKISPEPVTLLLVFNASGRVETVLASESTSKADCFAHSYRGIQLSKPPFAPFVLKLTMK